MEIQMKTTLYTTGLIALFTLGLVVSGCKSNSMNPYGSTPTGPAPSAASPNTVLMSGMAFSPATITVSAGTTVTWKNNDGIAHTSTSDSGVWNTGNVTAAG